ncbi:MAG: hypothetical protein GEV10_05300 [Streptosporangiales bacterium]|nr:hypothetical protein [Streptosporangiales bacterium]
MSSTRTGRGLAAWLTSRTDDEVAALLAARPDLLHPVPPDFGRLAGAVASRASMQLAVDRLDTLALQILRTLATRDDTATYDELAAAMQAPPDGRLRDTVDLLRARALCFGDDDALDAPGELRRMPLLPAEFGPHIAHALAEIPPMRQRVLLDDVGAPHVEEWQALRELAVYFAKPANVQLLLADVSPAAREALVRVASSHGHGRVADAHRSVSVATASSPVEELLARGLLVASVPDTVVIPFEVATVLQPSYGEPPVLDTTTHDPSVVDRTGGLHAHAVVQAVEDLLATWSDTPPSQLRSGGLGVRELRRVADLLDLPTEQAALVVETAHAAALLDATYPAEEWLPTEAFDAWRTRPVAERWATLAAAWLDTSRAAGLVGQKDERDKTINALGSGVLHGSVAQVREATLGALATMPPGVAPTTESLVGRTVWDRPRSGGRRRRELLEWTLREAEQLGVCGQAAITSYGRALLDGDTAAATRLLASCLPELGEQVLVQPDLTAVAPGPLRPAVRTELGLLADVESTGAATVYRFTPQSVRRALDAGRTAAGVHDWLTAHSRTTVPQPLHYLVDDVARRHGQLRAGSATSYVRCDDPALLAEIVAHRKAGPLALRLIAPTVLVSQVDRKELLDSLRELGYAPVAESATGDVVVTTSRTRRAQTRARPSWRPQSPTERPNPQLVEQAVRMLRAGERVAGERVTEHRSATATLPRNPPRDTLAAIQRSIAADHPLWIGYANAEGRASLRLIEPVAVVGGLVEAYDHLRESRRTFALHRITGYATVDDDG